MVKQEHYVVDCFPYFNEEQLLELRINLLKDYVDKFIIVDGNYTHNNKKKEYSANKVLSKLNLLSEKIEVIELDMSDEALPPPNYYDNYWNCYPSRERIQRDAISKCLETNNFSDDTTFIIGDCDEIVNPKCIEIYKSACIEKCYYAYKAPLDLLEGRADRRLYFSDNPNTPAPWDSSLYFCGKYMLENYSLSALRAGMHGDITYHIPQSSSIGWHFSWMGTNENRLLKSESFCHAEQQIDELKYGKYTNESMKKYLLEYDINSGETPSGISGYILKEYSHEELPQILFDLPRVKEFLLPE